MTTLVRISVSSPASVTVRCSRDRLLVGLIAARTTIGIPDEIPPNMPPVAIAASVNRAHPRRALMREELVVVLAAALQRAGKAAAVFDAHDGGQAETAPWPDPP